MKNAVKHKDLLAAVRTVQINVFETQFTVGDDTGAHRTRPALHHTIKIRTGLTAAATVIDIWDLIETLINNTVTIVVHLITALHKILENANILAAIICQTIQIPGARLTKDLGALTINTKRKFDKIAVCAQTITTATMHIIVHQSN